MFFKERAAAFERYQEKCATAFKKNFVQLPLKDFFVFKQMCGCFLKYFTFL